VAGLLGVRLVALEIVDRRLYALARALAGADGIDGMADCLQRLKRHHRFVILGEVAREEQNLLCCHRMPPVVEGRRRTSASLLQHI
jgi:hypothetical protein